MRTEVCGTFDLTQWRGVFRDHEPSGIRERPRLQAINVYATGQPSRIESHCVIARSLVLVHQQ